MLATATVAIVRNTAVRLTIVAAFAVIGLSAGIASGGPAAAQTPVVTGTIVASPASTGPGTTVQVTAVFTPSVTLPDYRVSINLTGTSGQGTIAATPVSATSGLSSCVIDSVQRSMNCNWLTNTAVAQTLVVTVNVGSGATPSTTSWELTANAASQTQNLVELARTNIEILAEYAGTAIAVCDGGDQPVTVARNTGAKDLTYVQTGSGPSGITGFPLPAGESITVPWPNGTDGTPIPVLDWEMRPPGFTTVVESGTLQLPDCTPPDVNRIFGDTRFSTAVAVAQEYIPLGCEYVIANGLDFPDGLASAVYDLPILLTTTDDLPADTAAELESLATSGCTGNLVLKIVGGTAAVSSAQQDLLAATYGATVTRVFGTDRYTTSIAIANEVFAGITPFGEAIITTGLNFPDALAGGVLSAYRGAPILLNDGDSVRADVGDFLDDAGITKVYILGGTDAVPASVETELSTAHGVTTERLDGANRWGTAVAIADEISDLGSATGPSNNEIVLVNGLGFADALAAAPYAFDLDVSPILLTAADSVPAETAAYHQTYCDEIDFITIIGGLAAVSAGVADAAVTAATCPTP